VKGFEFKIVIDGEKDDFYKSINTPDEGHFQITHHTYCNGAMPDGANDLYAEVWVGWDSIYFYLYEEVKDDKIFLNNTNPRANDCLELHFDANPEHPDTTVSNIRLSVLDSIDVDPAFWAGVSNMDPQVPGFKGAGTYHDYVRKLTPNGYILELRIAWDSLSTDNKKIKPEINSRIGFAMNNNDNDSDGRDGTIMWSAVVDDAVKDNREFLGMIQFLDDNKLKMTAMNFISGAANPNANTYNINFVVNVESQKNGITPDEFSLNQNYPNPFNPSTTIKYSLADAGNVLLAVYDMLGREVQTLVNKLQEASSYTVHFNADNLSSGIYLYKLQIDGKVIGSKKMILMR
jgi:hypothetical protein